MQHPDSNLQWIGIPTWDQTPFHQSIDLGEQLRYDLSASDLSGIHHYWINDTIHFTIDETGNISNVTALAVGTYWLEVKAYDPYGLCCSTIFAVEVQYLSTLPTQTEVPLWMITAIGGVGVIVGIGAFILFRRRRKSP